MKIMKKHLSLLLAVSFLLGLVVVSTAITVSAEEPSKYLDLNLSGFQTVLQNACETHVGSGITATGDWSGSAKWTFTQRSNAGDDNTVKLGSFPNAADGTTYFIDYYDKYVQEQSYAAHMLNLKMWDADNNYEKYDNTISFWINATERIKWIELFCYRVDFNNNGYETFDLGLLKDGENWNLKHNLTGIEHATTDVADPDDGKFAVPKGWNHVVITNPKRSGGTKTMNLYVNGAFKKSVTLNIPDDATINHATPTFFAKGNSGREWYRPNLQPVGKAQLGGIKVYQGVLDQDAITGIYNAQLPSFTESSLPDITGYTFEDAIVEYDGDSHNITVTAAEGATEGVTKTYTSGGSAFNGATEVGSYPITATLTKEGYNDLTLTATLTIAPPVGEKLVDLDLTNFASTTTANANGIVNTGALSTAVIRAASSPYVENAKIDADYLYNKDNLSNSKKVLWLHHKEPAISTKAYYAGTTLDITDDALATQDITLSFWVNLDELPTQTTGNAYCAIAQYDIKKSDNNWTKATIWQGALENNSTFTFSKNWSANIQYVDNTNQWHQIVMVIPAFESGSKTVKFYIDGLEKTDLAQTLSLGSASVELARIHLASDQAQKYVPGDISFGDIKIYSGCLTDANITTKYNEEKAFYHNIATNKISVSNGSDTIKTLTNLADNAEITINYNENIAPDVRLFAGAYASDGTLLSVNTVETSGTGSFSLTVPAAATKVCVFTWDNVNYMPIQKITTLER